MRYENPWDTGWRSFLLWCLLILTVSTFVYFMWVSPKLDLCETYYKELNTWSCFRSNYGLPATKGR